MRYLTIKRQRSFVACLATFKVYIEDHEASELEIGGVPCRKLGTLKNGQEASFRISESAAKVFVIADKLSKDYCNDCYALPAGPESVTLTGKCILNPLAGNPFYFKGLDPEFERKRRKKTIVASSILAAIIALAVAAAIIIGSIEPPAPQHTFTVDNLQITLNEDFVEFDAEGYARAMDSKNVAVMILQEEFTLMLGLEDYTLEQYGQLVLSNNTNRETSGLQVRNGVMYFEYDTKNIEDGKEYRYIVTMYKGNDAFWLVQYIVRSNEADKYYDDIFQWASSVRFIER